MSITIRGYRRFSKDFVMVFDHPEFTQESFDAMLTSGRTLADQLYEQGIDLTQEFGKDLLLLAFSQQSLELFGEINYQLCHCAYRFVCDEIKNGSFDTVYFSQT